MTRGKARKPARPQEGGRYIRQKNGALKRVAETLPADTRAGQEPPAGEPPAEEAASEEQAAIADTEIPPEDAADSEQEG
jgi:hypothetical protein